VWQRLRPFKPIAGPLLFLLVAGPWFYENAREFGAAGPTLMLWNQGLGRASARWGASAGRPRLRRSKLSLIMRTTPKI